MQFKREIICEYQNQVDHPPVPAAQLHANACSSDEITVKSWAPTWYRNYKENHEKYGPFAERSVTKFFRKNEHRPAIVAGSGPSLKFNADQLKSRANIPLISCLHNFHYFEDLGLEPDFYVTLDAGEVTIDEVSEGGKKTPEEYWEMTQDRTLIAYTGTSPRLLEKWQGEIYFFHCLVPDDDLNKKCAEVENFPVIMGTGGNVLGAAMYFAKGWMASDTIIYVGADFSFSGQNKFHSWDSKYDEKLGQCLRVTDVFGNKVNTWQSYYNFKNWFDFIAESVPCEWINASEGGCLGAYDIGNIRSIKQMPLEAVLKRYSLSTYLEGQVVSPEELHKQEMNQINILF
jgi:hypothetical protein